MIHLEQAGQPFRVILGQFRTVDQPQQPIQQGMAAPQETGGYGADAGAQPGLFARQPQRFPVHPVEGPGHLADLIAGLDVHGCRGKTVPRVPGHAQRADLRGQARPGDIQGGGFEPPERTHDRPGDHQGDQEDQGEGGQSRAGR